jgi:cell division protease FtsH
MQLRWIITFLFGLGAGTLFSLFVVHASEPAPDMIAINDLAHLVKDGAISAIAVHGDRAIATAWDGQQYSVRLGQNDDVPGMLRSFGVTPAELANLTYIVDQPSWASALPGLLLGFLPLLFLGAMLVVFLRQSSGSSNPFMGLAKSGARRFVADTNPITFSDVAGVEEAKQELQEIVEFLKYPEKFAALGARIPRGVLLVGPPGTGKTLISRAVAGEAGVPFFSTSGSEFVELFVGVGASRVRDLFGQAKRNAPCIVFVDEIDAVGRQRGTSVGGVHEEREQTLNQILVEMDGFDSHTSVIVIAATNRPDVLDAALLRPGRFDRQVVLPAPDMNGRQAILQVHATGKPLDGTVKLATLARITPGFSGADLANVINEGAILAARRDKRAIGMAELEEAIDRVIAGPECKSRLMSEHDRLLTAYHESGHALAMHYLEHHDPVQKVTIIARGMVGGYTRPLPPEDRHYMTRSQFEAMLASALGGHASEHVVFGEISTGAENDIHKATTIARKMVTQYGMSERLGTVALGRPEERGFAGGAMSEHAAYSESTAQAVDQEVRRLIDEGYARAVQIINAHRDVLDRLAQALMEYETLDGENLARIFDGEAPIASRGAPEPARPRNNTSQREERRQVVPVPRLSPGAAAWMGSAAPDRADPTL